MRMKSLPKWMQSETPESDPEFIGAFRKIPIPDPDAWAMWQEEHKSEIDTHLEKMKILLQSLQSKPDTNL